MQYKRNYDFDAQDRRIVQALDWVQRCRISPPACPAPPQDGGMALRGYEEISTGVFVPAAQWTAYCLDQCGVADVDETAPWARAFLDMLGGWMASGNYVPVYSPV